MAYSFRHTNPELAGVLVREAVRCGKKNCRCSDKKRLHKWYYYLYWRDYKNSAGLRKRYVPQSEVKKLRQKIRSAKSKDVGEKLNLQAYIALTEEIKQILET